MIKNIIFDWSGVLSNDIIPVHTAIMNVFRKLGIKTLSLEEYKKEFILPYMRFFHKFKKNVDKKEVDKIFLKEINSVNKPKPFLGTGAILQFLKQKNIKITVLSSHPQKKLEKEIKDYRFQKLFTDVNGGIHDKVKAIIAIIKKNRFKPGETAYIGDMTHDIEAGKRAKVTTIAVSWGYQTKETLSKEKPDFLIENLNELKNIII